jgi:hypothetical protein
MLVTIWINEKERTFEDERVKKAHDEELDNILNIELSDESNWEEEELWDIPEGFERINQQGEEVHKVDHNLSKTKHNISVAPTADDTDQTIDEYIDKVYPHYPRYNAHDRQDIPPRLNHPWQYNKQPVVQSTTRNCTTTIERHHWEPFAWAFNNIKWQDHSNQSDNSKGITFIELAILINIMTDGATAREVDLATQAKITKIAFRKYFPYSKPLSTTKMIIIATSNILIMCKRSDHLESRTRQAYIGYQSSMKTYGES